VKFDLFSSPGVVPSTMTIYRENRIQNSGEKRFLPVFMDGGGASAMIIYRENPLWGSLQCARLGGIQIDSER
jgi:hypothetical protein